VALTVEAPVPATAADSALLGVYRRAAPLFVSGHGCRLVAEDGREYLDFTSGIGVNALGYGDAGVRAAIERALDTGIIHVSNLFRTTPGEELAQELVTHSFADRVFFCNSGAEAVEGAMKFARRWARRQAGPEKHELVALRGSFHGRLFGSLAATDRPAYQAPFTPLTPGVRILDAADDVARIIDSARTAAILAEPVQGEGGIHPLPAERLRQLRELADAANALLIFDEVQCGLGRTGRLFAYEASGVEPDLMALAKPLAGGLPMGAVLLTDRVAATLEPGDHATTFGGGPLVATVALDVFRRIAAPAFLAQVRALGTRVQAIVNSWQGAGIVALRGTGLMWGIELDRPAAPIVARALELGLLLVPAGERVIRLLPPLVITEPELAAGLAILREALQ
jgi:predicted acetylornithine/succinylornithine family transaminase